MARELSLPAVPTFSLWPPTAISLFGPVGGSPRSAIRRTLCPHTLTMAFCGSLGKQFWNGWVTHSCPQQLLGVSGIGTRASASGRDAGKEGNQCWGKSGFTLSGHARKHTYMCAHTHTRTLNTLTLRERGSQMGSCTAKGGAGRCQKAQSQRSSDASTQ